MNTVSIHEVPSGTKVISVDDTAIYLRLFYPELVGEILEAYTDCNDIEIIQEVIDAEDLEITCVTEHSGIELLIHGYIHGGVNV